MDVVLSAHELHSVLGTSLIQPPRLQVRSRAEGGPYCFTSRTCPNCFTEFPGAQRTPRHTREPLQNQPATQPPEPGNTDAPRDPKPAGKRQGNFKGWRVFHRGNPPPVNNSTLTNCIRPKCTAYAKSRCRWNFTIIMEHTFQS